VTSASRPSFFRRLAGRFAGGPVWRGGPSDMVATLYEDGVILNVSPSAAELIGATGDLVGRSIFDFVARDDRSAVRGAFRHATEQDLYADPANLTVDFTLLRVRKAAAPAEIMIRPIGRGRLAALIRQTHKPREKMVAAEPTPAQTPAAPGADLIGDLAHELKTPLNAIIGFADAMRAETYGPLGADVLGARKYAEYVGHIHASGAHLSALISAAQDYAKTRVGQYKIDRALSNPGVLAEECAAMVRGAAEKAGLSFRLSIEDDLPDAMLDQRAVKQILVNLLSNAVKFTNAGEVSLGVARKGGDLVFTVSDTGVGMNKVVLAKLGGRYSDTHRTGVRGAEGTGLGLSLAFDLARLHDGALHIESEEGAGTTARFTTAIAADAAAPSPVTQTAPAKADIQSQLDRVNAFRAERARAANAA